jgi:hypothetical protein
MVCPPGDTEAIPNAVPQKGAAISRYGAPLVLRRGAPIRSDPGLTGHAMDAVDPPLMTQTGLADQSVWVPRSNGRLILVVSFYGRFLHYEYRLRGSIFWRCARTQ